MLSTLLICGAISTILALVTMFLWQKVQFDWLNKTTIGLVWSLPFEYFPKLEIAGSSLRVSQVLVILGVYFILILIFKKDRELLGHRIHWVSIFPIIFWFLASPSWLFITDFKRFLVYFVATNLVFGAMVILANFGTNIWQRLKELSLILGGCAVFGLYQFVGDMLGLPSFLTGLREQYTKIVFGVPRVQGTAIEPLYFAGMLLLAMIIFWFWNLNRLSNLEKIDDNSPNKNNINLIKILSGITLLSFILTISKGTFAVLVLILPALFVASCWHFVYFQNLVHRFWIVSLTSCLSLVMLMSVFVDPVKVFGEVGQNFVETIAGTSASAVERSRFINEAVVSLPNNAILGIGMGQYADYVGSNLGNINTEESKAIVNNVYLEVWLENGFLAFGWFLLMLFLPLILLFKQLDQNLTINSATILILIFSLVAYYLQWTLFSPIFIMPIFILLGMSYKSCKLS